MRSETELTVPGSFSYLLLLSLASKELTKLTIYT